MANVDSTGSKWSLASIREQLSERQELQPVLSNISWLFANNIIRIISGLIVGAWVARYLGPDDRGIMNYAIAYVALFMPLTELGFGSILIRELVRRPQEKGTLMGTAFVMQVVAFLLLLPVIVISVKILRAGDPAAQQAVYIMLIGSAFHVSITFKFWFDSQLKSKYFVMAQRSVDLIGAGIRVVLILVQASLSAFLLAIAFQSFLGFIGLALFYLWSGERFRTWGFSLDWAKRLFRDGWPLAISLLAITVNLRIDTVMIGQMMDDYSVGVYGEAARLSQLWYFVPLAISTSAYPVLVRAHKELSLGEQKKRYQRFFDSLAGVGYLIAIPSAILAPFIVGLLYGPQYAQTSAILSIHIWALIFVGFGLGLRRWLAVENLTVYSLWSALSGAVVNIVLNLIFIPRFGAIGAAWTMVFSSAVSGYLICLFLPRLHPVFRQLTIALLLPIRVPVLLYRQFVSDGG